MPCTKKEIRIAGLGLLDAFPGWLIVTVIHAIYDVEHSTVSDPCQPAIDGTWKNLVTDYGGDPTGARSSSPAVGRWLAFGRSQAATPVKLYIPPGTYHLTKPNGLTNGIVNATVSGWGATVSNLFIGSAGVIPTTKSYSASARIQTAYAGDTSVTVIDHGGTLVAPADVRLFAINDWIMITGLALQTPDTYPQSWQNVEFRKIMGITGNTIFFSNPLQYLYKSTWPYIDAFPTAINIGSSTLTCAASPLVEERRSILTTSGSLPTPLRPGQLYFAKNVSGLNFQLSARPGGPPIRLSGTQSGTHFYHSNSEGELGGPATIYKLSSIFDGEHNYYGLSCSASGGVFFGGGKQITLCGMSFAGLGPAPSAAKTVIIRRTQIGSQNEVDKCVEYLEYDRCYSTVGLGQIFLQSSSIMILKIKNCALKTLNGTAKNTIVENSNFTTEVIVGPSQYGRSEMVRISNSNIASARQSDLFADPSTLSFKDGTFAIANVSAGRVWQWAVPGMHYFFAFYDGAIHKNDDATGKVWTFMITDLRQDATNTYIDTDIGNVLPTPTFSGGQFANQYVAWGAEAVTQSDTSPANVTQFGAIG